MPAGSRLGPLHVHSREIEPRTESQFVLIGAVLKQAAHVLVEYVGHAVPGCAPNLLNVTRFVKKINVSELLGIDSYGQVRKDVRGFALRKCCLDHAEPAAIQ